MPRNEIVFAAALLAATAMANADDLGLASASSARVPAPVETPVLPVDAIVDGVSLGQWTARWWQWAFAQPIAPYLDPDGSFCAEGQAGPVWFLAGTNGRFNVQRECVVPAGRYLLVPVINMIYMNRHAGNDPDKTRPCADLQSDAAVNNDHLVSAVVMIDGVVVKDVVHHRVRSDGCFALAAADGGQDATRTAAADGYWLLLEPLPIGRHTITVGANYGAPDSAYGHMLQNFEYVLHVGARTNLVMLHDWHRGAQSSEAGGNRSRAGFNPPPGIVPAG